MLRVRSLVLGVAAMLPASILLSALGQFSPIRPSGEFMHFFYTAAGIAFIAVWSCYILSLSTLLKNKRVPTSLEGMKANAFLGLGFGLGLVPYLMIALELKPAIFAAILVVAGMTAAGCLLGFYIGYSSARFENQVIKGFLYRQIGILGASMILLGHLVLAYRLETIWLSATLPVLLVFTLLTLGGHYLRAARQHRKYINRRYKQRESQLYQVATAL